MSVVTRLELENAQRDVADLEKIVNGVATTPNVPNPLGTVTTRLGGVAKNVARFFLDIETAAGARLTPTTYYTLVAMNNALAAAQYGQWAYNRETFKVYVAQEGPSGKEWSVIGDLGDVQAALREEMFARKSAVGRLSISDYEFYNRWLQCFEVDCLQRGIKWRAKTTVNNGLALILGASTLPAYTGVEGVDFGCLTPAGSLVNATTLPDWDVVGSRLRIYPAGQGTSYENLNVPGYVDINSGIVQPVFLKNCVIDTNYGAYYGISKFSNPEYPLYMQNCTIKRVTGEGLNLNGGFIADSLIEFSQGDAMKAIGQDITIDGCLFRALGQVVVTAHCDVVQSWDVRNLTITRNTFYMPYAGGPYDDGTGSYGSTNVIRLSTEVAGDVIENVFILGNILVGGGFTMTIHARYVGTTVRNIVIANNIIGNSSYAQYGGITDFHKSANVVGLHENMILHNNKQPSGAGLMSLAGVDQNGIWHFNKPTASRDFIEFGQKFGYLDWNGDLKAGVTNRTAA